MNSLKKKNYDSGARRLRRSIVRVLAVSVLSESDSFLVCFLKTFIHPATQYNECVSTRHCFMELLHARELIHTKWVFHCDIIIFQLDIE